MNAGTDIDLVAANAATIKAEDKSSLESNGLQEVTNSDMPLPTAEELQTLRRVSGKVPWTAYTVAFVELCERFSYYGTTAVCRSYMIPAIIYKD